ncbi:hypothetical protein [Lentilactobacillus kisonensis]|uniref:hypothetical protein n=1 Tax=Lentilactobacillus kisonensis TaxID=481722 RepID=UPI002436E1F2|nr:hypothetical protein [Lentilactobacillus kisonensis]
MVHLSARPLPGTTNCTLGRETSIQKVVWTKDGWLHMKAGGTLAQPTTEGMKDVKVSEAPQAVGVNADFSKGSIDKHLMSPYGPRTEDWCTAKK